MAREAREGRIDSPSYLTARSRSRLFVNSSAFSARLRQRAACSFRNELSIETPNTTLNELRRLPHLTFYGTGFFGQRPPCEFVRSKSLSERVIPAFAGCGYAADNPARRPAARCPTGAGAAVHFPFAFSPCCARRKSAPRKAAICARNLAISRSAL
jgi:hypothetical protein